MKDRNKECKEQYPLILEGIKNGKSEFGRSTYRLTKTPD